MEKFKKNLILGITSLLGCLIITSCNLEEDPPNLSPDSIFASEASTQAALNGVFNAMADFNYYSADFHHLTNFTSSLFFSGVGTDRTGINAFAPTSSNAYVRNVWSGAYRAITRSNDIIAGIDQNTANDNIKNMLGIAYFLRAHNYFNLVRIYGGVPLKVAATTLNTIHEPRATVDDVYDLIIEDAKKAEALMYDVGAQQAGQPTKKAANMLLAKAYMTLAGNNPSSPFWMQARTEALKVRGNFSLIPNYINLWNDTSTANNNSESIFEIQFNVENPSSLVRLFTPNLAYPGPGWRRISPHPETIDMHMAQYPGDPRINGTFISSFPRFDNGASFNVYPTNPNRGWFGVGFPHLYKYFIKDATQTSSETDFNYVRYRYADLLLMLAEIENEISGPSNAYQYVNEVLARARNSQDGATQPADWSGLTQDEFRNAIMREYQYELLGEGHDFFVGRRRGYQFFKENYIDVHNSRNNRGFDIMLPDDNKIMLLPIPLSEINVNEKISVTDQNPGY